MKKKIIFLFDFIIVAVISIVVRNIAIMTIAVLNQHYQMLAMSVTSNYFITHFNTSFLTIYLTHRVED